MNVSSKYHRNKLIFKFLLDFLDFSIVPKVGMDTYMDYIIHIEDWIHLTC